MLLDIFVLVVVVVSSLVGLLRGLVREVMTLLGLGGGIAAAWIAAPYLAPTVAGWLGKPDEVPEGEAMPKLFDVIPYDLAGTILAWVVIILAVLALVSLLSHLLAEATKSAGLGVADNTAGALFGVARGAVIVAVLYLPVAVLADAKLKEQWLASGVSYQVLEDTSAKILPLLPGLERDPGEDAAPVSEEEAQEDEVLPEPTPAPAGTGYEDAVRDGMEALLLQSQEAEEGRAE